jgi:hypothetical protein
MTAETFNMFLTIKILFKNIVGMDGLYNLCVYARNTNSMSHPKVKTDY